MKMSVVAIVVAVFAVVVTAALLVTNHPDGQHSAIPFVLGAVVGTQTGTFIIWKQGAPELTFRVKATLGVVLALATAAAAYIADAVFGMSPFPEVTIPIDSVGAGLFPFVLSGILWRALDKSRPKPPTPAA